MRLNLASRFLHRVVSTSVGVAAVGLLIVLSTLRTAMIVSYVAGVSVGVLILKGLEISVRESLRPKGAPLGRIEVAVGAFLGHWLVILLILFTLSRTATLHPLAFCGGFLIVQIVLVAKVLALLWLQRRDLPNKTTDPPTDGGN